MMPLIFSDSRHMNFDFHQNISSVLAILFVALLSTLLSIITVTESDVMVSQFKETVATHQLQLKK